MKKIGNLKLNAYSRNALISYGLVLIFFVAVTLMKGAGMINSHMQGMLVPVCAYAVLAVSLNLVVGISGELSLGHAGFMAVGAFAAAVTSSYFQETVTAEPVRLLIALVVGGIASGIVGFIIGIPVLRLRGDYLAIVTLAFGEIIRNLLNITYIGLDEKGLHFAFHQDSIHLSENGKMILTGPMGATGMTKLSSFTAGILLVLFTLFVVQNIINSKQGRAIMAIRDNRIAAEATGLSVMKYKMTAFVTSAALAGMGGALFALNYSGIAPSKFTLNTSVFILVYVVLGGMGNIWGSMIAAAVLTILPEALRAFADYRMLTYAIVLILVMLATNNPTIKSYTNVWAKKLRPKKKGGGDGAGMEGSGEQVEGGALNA